MSNTVRALFGRPLTTLMLALVLAIGLVQVLWAAGHCPPGPTPCEMGQLVNTDAIPESCALACGAILLPLVPDGPLPRVGQRPVQPPLISPQPGQTPPPDLRPPIPSSVEE